MITTKAFAKLDLGIHIEPARKVDGYYRVQYIDCQIDLFDELTFEAGDKKIEVFCNSPWLTRQEDNFVYITAVKLRKIVGNRKLGAKITLKKNIPIRAGFGGGSSDGAATLLGLCKLWNVKLNKLQITSLARELGKDFYYSLYGGLSEIVGEGKNYKISKIKGQMANHWLLVVVPSVNKPSTSWVYEHLKVADLGKNYEKFEKLKAALVAGSRVKTLSYLSNDFEPSVITRYPILESVKRDLLIAGAEASIMAGAGLSVVGFFDSKGKAEAGKKKLLSKKGIKQILVAKVK